MDLYMPQQSKYSNEDFDALFSEIIGSLEKHKATPDLALMVLGNTVTNVLQHQVKPEFREEMAEKFCQVLLSSVKE